MSKMFSLNGFRPFLATLTLTMCLVSSAMGADRFALALGPHDNLVVLGPNGERLPELTIPTIAKSVTVGGTSFQISYGRDANDLLTAVLTPDSTTPQDLHFSVCGTSVDTSKSAVVTLTFRDSKHVVVDPGYIGTVAVNSHVLGHHVLAGNT